MPTLTLGPLLVWLTLVPMVYLLVSSFKPTGLVYDPGFTLEHYRDLISDPTLLPVFANTLFFAVASTAFAILIGGTLAWLVERTNMPARSLATALIIIPMAVPPVLLAIAWVMLLDPTVGTFNAAIRSATGYEGSVFNIFTFRGMIYVEALALVPTSFLMLSPAFRNMDPSLEEAAFASGAGLFRTLWQVVIPILRPALAGAGIFLLMACFVIFDIPGIIGVPARYPVFSTSIVKFALDSPTGLPQYGRVSALAVFLLVVMLALTICYTHVTSNSQRFVTMTGKGFRARRYSLGKARYWALGVVLVYFVLAVLLPLLMLVWTSLMPFRAGFSISSVSLLSFDNYYTLFSNRRFVAAAINSSAISVVVGTAVAAICLAVSWTILRSKAPGRSVLDLLTFAPLALSGVMIGSALLFVYLSVNIIPIYGTIWIIIVAHITIYLAFGTKTTTGALIQLSADLEDAGAASGANRFFVIRKITVPLMWPTLMGLWIWVVAHSVRELSSALMLQGRSNVTLSTLLWNYWSGGQPTAAAAVGVVMLVVLIVLVAFWQASSVRLKGSAERKQVC